MNNFPLLQVSHLSGGYPHHPVLHDLSFTMEKGEVVGILGPNGCGKSTLIKSICGLLSYQGSCKIQGEEVSSLSIRQRSRKISYVPQRSGIDIALTVLDVVLMGFNPNLPLRSSPTAVMKEKAHAALKQVGLADMEQQLYPNLSEGQKQLCILARTLTTGSELILLDEPESALDFSRRYQMMKMLRSWCLEEKKSVLMILHDPQLALNYCDRLVLLKDGKNADEIRPSTDSAEKMEDRLSTLFGPLSLQSCPNKQGKDQWVILE